MTIVPIALLTILLNLGTPTPIANHDDCAWLENSGPSIWLGAWHRGCPADETVTTFIVSEPSGRELRQLKTVKTSEFFGVLYPDDFGSAFTSGKYKWRCEIHGQVVAHCRFEWQGIIGGMRLTVLKP
jgi:hypothetical protein